MSRARHRSTAALIGTTQRSSVGLGGRLDTGLAHVACLVGSALLLATTGTAEAQGGPIDGPIPVEDTPGSEAKTLAQRDPQVVLEPADGLMLGQPLKVRISLQRPEGSDVTLPSQNFEPFELINSAVVREALKGSQQRFTFDLTLISLQPGDLQLPPIDLRLVDTDGELSELETEAIQIRVQSPIANEPEPDARPPSAPAKVWRDDYTLAWIVGAVLAALLLVAATLRLARWWQARPRTPEPPPPPRPPGEIALEQLERLKQRQRLMVEDGKGEAFIDGVNDTLRAYLGARYGFDGLESTSEEVMATLHAHPHDNLSLHSLARFLDESDLVKFARVAPGMDLCDLLWGEARALVQTTRPSPVHGDLSPEQITPSSVHRSPDARSGAATSGDTAGATVSAKVSAGTSARQGELAPGTRQAPAVPATTTSAGTRSPETSSGEGEEPRP